MTKLTLILTLNDPRDALPDPNRPSRRLKRAQMKKIQMWD